MHNVIIYGGTFDPVHNGHLQTAINVQKHMHFDRFLFLPCKIPVLKNKAIATAEQRITMLQLALAELKQYRFELNLSEIYRDSPSYTVDSLTNFRNQWGSVLPITLLMGIDTFNDIPKWHNWQQLLALAHIMVIKRAGVKDKLSATMQVLLNQHQVFNKTCLLTEAHGCIYRYDAGYYNFSSSWIRNAKPELNSLKAFLPAAVFAYIKQHNLYC